MIATKVKKIVAEQAARHPDSINLPDRLWALGLDSLDAVEITIHIEEEFDIAIEPDYTWQTVISDIIAQVEELSCE